MNNNLSISTSMKPEIEQEKNIKPEQSQKQADTSTQEKTKHPTNRTVEAFRRLKGSLFVNDPALLA